MRAGLRPRTWGIPASSFFRSRFSRFFIAFSLLVPVLLPLLLVSSLLPASLEWLEGDVDFIVCSLRDSAKPPYVVLLSYIKGLFVIVRFYWICSEGCQFFYHKVKSLEGEQEILFSFSYRWKQGDMSRDAVRVSVGVQRVPVLGIFISNPWQYMTFVLFYRKIVFICIGSGSKPKRRKYKERWYQWVSMFQTAHMAALISIDLLAINHSPLFPFWMQCKN